MRYMSNTNQSRREGKAALYRGGRKSEFCGRDFQLFVRGLSCAFVSKLARINKQIKIEFHRMNISHADPLQLFPQIMKN